MVFPGILLQEEGVHTVPWQESAVTELREYKAYREYSGGKTGMNQAEHRNTGLTQVENGFGGGVQ